MRKKTRRKYFDEVMRLDELDKTLDFRLSNSDERMLKSRNSAQWEMDNITKYPNYKKVGTSKGIEGYKKTKFKLYLDMVVAKTVIVEPKKTTVIRKISLKIINPITIMTG